MNKSGHFGDKILDLEKNVIYPQKSTSYPEGLSENALILLIMILAKRFFCIAGVLEC
ncbi:hypothetical protein THIOSC13_1770021 [uncultured Thiomicrorhabdus sp.]